MTKSMAIASWDRFSALLNEEGRLFIPTAGIFGMPYKQKIQRFVRSSSTKNPQKPMT